MTTPAWKTMLDTADAELRAVKAERNAALAEVARLRTIVDLYQARPHYFDDCDPGQNDPWFDWSAEMDRLIAALAPEATP